MAGTVKHAHNKLMRRHAFFSRHGRDILCHRFVEINDVGGVARANRDFVHVHIGRVEQIAFFSHSQYRQRVRARFCGNRRAFQWIERDVDFGTRTNRGTDLFTNEEHRRFVPFAFADDDRSIHI